MILAILFFWASFAIANDDEHKCFPPPSTSIETSDLIECLSNVQKTVEAELNENYQRSMTPIMLPSRMRTNLRKTQRLWISYRDAVCKAQGDPRREGGQFGITLCMIRITRQRIADIEMFYTVSR
jgi:uncharacterized protein YecT (DUF1311 family)